jgi:WD40 domain-containing protein
VQEHTRLLTHAKEWESEGKDSSFLLRGKDLREAERWVAKSAEKEPKPTTLHSQYILASRQAATKLQRIVIGAVAVAFLIAVGLAIYAFQQKNVAQRQTSEAEHQRGVAETNATEARRQKKAAEDSAEEATRQKNAAVKSEKEAKRQEGIAEEETSAAQRNARESKARELAAYATESLSDDRERSILLGMQAVNATLRFGRPPVSAAEEALHQAILSSQASMLTLRGHSDYVNSVAYSPDGKRLATAGADRTVQVYALDPRDLLDLARSRVTRDFTVDECRRYFQAEVCPPLP